MKLLSFQKSLFGLVVVSAVLAGCSSPRKQADVDTNRASAQRGIASPLVSSTPADVPAADNVVKQKPTVKSPVNLGAASSGQGL